MASPNVSRACRRARLDRVTAYRHRNSDPAFAAAWDEALQIGIGAAEDEAWRRANDGVLKPVFHGGQKVGSVREYSDTLLIFLLKAHRPERYREAVLHGGVPGQPVQVEVVGVDYRSALAAVAPGPMGDSSSPSEDEGGEHGS